MSSEDLSCSEYSLSLSLWAHLCRWPMYVYVIHFQKPILEHVGAPSLSVCVVLGASLSDIKCLLPFQELFLVVETKVFYRAVSQMKIEVLLYVNVLSRKF